MPRLIVAFAGLLFFASGGEAQTTLTPADAVRQAFAKRGSIAAARQRLEEAKRNAGAAGAYPTTRLDLGRNLFNETDIMGSADLLVYQPLDIFGKTHSLRRQGQAAVVVAVATYRQSALDVQQEVLTAYANLNSAERLLALAKSQRDLAESVRVATAKRVEARDLPEIQSTRAALEVDRSDQLVQDREAAAEAARLRLAAALGANEASPEQTLQSLEIPTASEGDPTLGRPEIQALRADRAQAEADERVAKQGSLPDLEIQAGRSTFAGPAQYGARLQLTANLWDDGANRSRARAAAARRKAAEAELQDRLNTVRKDIAAVTIELTAAQKAVAAYQKLAEGAQRLLERTQRGFELGASTLIDVLDARRVLSDAQELAIGALQRQDLAVEAVLRSQGRFLQEPK